MLTGGDHAGIFRPYLGVYLFPCTTSCDHFPLRGRPEDKGVWGDVEPDIRKALERAVLSPREETTFKVSYAPLDDPGPFRKWSKLVLVGSLDGDGSIADLLPSDVREKVGKSGGILYSATDLWAAGQAVFILATATRQEIPEYVRRSRGVLFAQLDALLRRQVQERMFHSGLNSELEKRLSDTYGFALSVPTVYRLDMFTGVERAVRLFNLNPQRSVIVAWEDGIEKEIDPDAVLRKRMALGGQFYPGDTLVEGKTQTEWIDFQGKRALKIVGLWENRENLEGGVFTTVAFNCPESHRFYMIDSILYEPDPKGSKYVYLIQLETITNSFRCSPAAGGTGE
jgi:hypothetical protein